SNGSIRNVGSISNLSGKSSYIFSEDNRIARQLSGLSLKNKNRLANYSYMEYKDKVKSVVNLYFEKDNRILPVFVRKIDYGREMFFLTKIAQDNLIDNVENRIGKDLFYEIAPFMMFLRYACKDRCWHSNNYFANLTIDDPWLREPYGNLSYVNLLDEMEKENFHTTIAFIPWNYDRSDKNVANLIINNLNRFSIVLHGNDHNHQEFYLLDKHNKKTEAKQLNEYGMKIKQALARMEKFKEQTKIPYDPIMVFPHRVAPRYAFSLLKKNDYLATINLRNVPFDEQEPSDPTHRLRCITTDFEGFPSIRRSEVDYINKESIAIDLFLENPIYLYTHQSYFADNMGRFNPIAGFINKLQPDVKWGSLGYIVKNYYLEKLREDGNHEILMYTNELSITNNSNDSLKYFIKKKELPLYSKGLQVFVDGRPISYRYDNKYITVEVMIPKQKAREILVKYANEIALVKKDLAKDNYYYAALRYISDFRDIVVSKNKYGRTIVDFYYYPAYYNNIIKTVIVIFGLFIVMFIFLKKRNIIFRDINKQ
ncbi:MAG: hypothetical protein ACXWE7_13325, partial [Nitrososphaeraceae archaeon]